MKLPSSAQVWANSSLDPICFVENDRGGVIDTRLDKPGRLVSILESILAKRNSQWLVDDDLSVADVAVGSYVWFFGSLLLFRYLCYVPVFFPDVDLSGSPAIAAYMAQCAERDAFRDAFGEDHVGRVLAAVENAQRNAGRPSEKPKIFGIF